MYSSPLRIATRNSPLALWQAEHIRQQLLTHWPQLNIVLCPMTTSGDQFLKDQLRVIGGKGLFVKELEESLLRHETDLAVHSMKDVPSVFPSGLILATICARDNPYDAFISHQYQHFHALPHGATLGTSSLRRQSQLLARRPDLRIKNLRGNIHTRLKSMDTQGLDGIILACAGLERMGLNEHIKEMFSAHDMLPACGQGALGIECRQDDWTLQALLKPLHDEGSALCVHTERRVSALLGGNCHVPLAVHCTLTDNTHIQLHARVISPDGQQVFTYANDGPSTTAPDLAQHCANELLAQGAGVYL